jgi:hypothetical protein
VSCPIPPIPAGARRLRMQLRDYELSAPTGSTFSGQTRLAYGIPDGFIGIAFKAIGR